MKRCFTKVSKWLINWKYTQPHCFSGTHKLKTAMWFHYTLNRKAKIDWTEWGWGCRTIRTFRHCRKECSWVAEQLCFFLKLLSCVQLFCDSMDCRPLGSSVHGIFQARTQPQFSSVAQFCPTLCNPMNCSMPGLPDQHQFPESTQTHVHWVSDVIQPSHPLSSPSPSAPNPS